MVLLSADLYPQVRVKIDLTLDQNTLPDSVIAMGVFAGKAEEEVLAIDPDAATRTGTARDRVLRAVIAFTAARICPSMPNIMSEASKEYNYRRQATDYYRLAESLRAEAQAELAQNVATTTTGTIPTLFSVVTGRRGL